MKIIDYIKKYRLGYLIGSVGFLVVVGYLAFEYLVYGEFLDDILERPIEHFIIFSIVPLSAFTGFFVEKKIHAERQVLQTKSQAEAILNHIDEGIVELDSTFKILSVNEFLLKLTKMTKSEVLGKTCYELFHRQREVCSDCPVEITFETGVTAYTEHEGIAKDGSKTYVELNSYPIRDSSGKVVRVVETVRDLSERKKHEEEMAEKRSLEKITQAAVGRELKMVELKNTIKSLEERIKKLESREK